MGRVDLTWNFFLITFLGQHPPASSLTTASHTQGISKMVSWKNEEPENKSPTYIAQWLS